MVVHNELPQPSGPQQMAIGTKPIKLNAETWGVGVQIGQVTLQLPVHGAASLIGQINTAMMAALMNQAKGVQIEVPT